MVESIQLLRTVGQFDSVSAGKNLLLLKLALLYAENSRGKTTLAAILRSLATGDPVLISERRRLSATQPPLGRRLRQLRRCIDRRSVARQGGFDFLVQKQPERLQYTIPV